MSRLLLVAAALLAACADVKVPVSEVAAKATATCQGACPAASVEMPLCGDEVTVSDGSVEARTSLKEEDVEGAVAITYLLTQSDLPVPKPARRAGVAGRGESISVPAAYGSQVLYTLKADGTSTVVDSASFTGQVENRLTFAYQSGGASVTEEHAVKTGSYKLETTDPDPMFGGCCATAGGRPMLLAALALGVFLVGRRR